MSGSKSRCYKKWAIPGLFLFIFIFSIQLIINKQMFNITFADDWSRTADLWYQKRLLYQLSHNHFHWRVVVTHDGPLQPVRPDLANFCRFDNFLKLFGNHLRINLASVKHNFEHSLSNTYLTTGANIHCLKWSNIGKNDLANWPQWLQPKKRITFIVLFILSFETVMRSEGGLLSQYFRSQLTLTE